MFKFFCIAAGGALGAVARYSISGWVQNAGPATFPWGTLCVNVVGSLLIGVFLGISELTPAPSAVRLLFAVGFIGAFTTFSTYSLETLNLFRDKEAMLGLMNIGLNNSLSLMAVFGAYFLSRSVVTF
ncbi:MAG: fluoride efflux transporter CrcB, partial [Planctomycetota bacterium]|nr:fluoride efflux transporter CrcB [Planctomycetota bacterium]